MMNNNKILTVSYGTFSCTLEGFDDSFDTMKAIAEYFRDLAADDRYFGAEPPQPDAEMLAKIAEREVSRRVEAREHEGRIMLKAHDDAATTIAAPAVARNVQAREEVETREVDASEIEAAEVETEIEPTAEAQAETISVSMSEELPAVEPVEREAATAVAPMENDEHEPDASEAPVTHAEVAPADASDTVTAEATDAPEQADIGTEDRPSEEVPLAAEASVAEEEDVDATQAEPVAAEEKDLDVVEDPQLAEDIAEAAASFFAQSTLDDEAAEALEEPASSEVFAETASQDDATESAEDLVAEEVQEPPLAQTESFADKLARIRAVVSEQETEEAVPEYDEDAVLPAGGGRFKELHEAFGSAQTDEIEKDAVVADAAHDITTAFAQDDEADEQSDLAEKDADDLDEILKRIEEASDDEEFDLAAAADVNEEDADETTENLFEAPFEAAAEAENDAVRGRVLKVNRSHLDAALASGELEEYEDENLPSEVSPSHGEEPASERDEATQDQAPAKDALAPEKSRQSLPNIGAETGEDISRLMAEADQHMQEPEAQTRRSAFAHLRAAVAARFADHSIGKNNLEDEAEAYRSDLAEVVKPRRPEVPSQRSERPTSSHSTPLKLVAEQRIGAEEPAEEKARSRSVSPRRVAASMEEDLALSDDTGFAAYAAERGAETLPQLLEAAAAYLSYVEGHEQFSRPQLMSRVRQADCGEFSREDGLRSFGQLLRNGKIQKIKGGRFTASEAIDYKPDHRAAG